MDSYSEKSLLNMIFLRMIMTRAVHDWLIDFPNPASSPVIFLQKFLPEVTRARNITENIRFFFDVTKLYYFNNFSVISLNGKGFWTKNLHVNYVINYITKSYKERN